MMRPKSASHGFQTFLRDVKERTSKLDAKLQNVSANILKDLPQAQETIRVLKETMEELKKDPPLIEQLKKHNDELLEASRTLYRSLTPEQRSQMGSILTDEQRKLFEGN